MANQQAKCKSCGQDIAKSAKSCPHCGAKNKKPTFLILLGIVVVLIVIIAASSGGDKNERPQDEPSTVPGQTLVQESSTKKQYLKVTALDLYAAYDENEVAADNKYKDQWIEITGTISSIDVVLGSTRISLVGEYLYDVPMGSVSCVLESSAVEKAGTLKKGGKVTIKGKCTGKSIYPQVVDCIF
ncbi:MAG: hypothetical protein LBT21_06880 [Oscillospiraceae bacterium]|jgi:hypothetical protein|nr:hypothetical protein [Oscillospiraceae bacterium]